jgi:hypothetical protein
MTMVGVVTVLGFARTADADCVVRTQDTNRVWREAAHALEESVQTTPNDCAVIDIRADRHGAFVDLQTTDGREAIRHIVAPNELGPLVRALLTSVPAAPAVEAAAATPSEVPPVIASPEPEADRAPEPVKARPIELFGGLAAGLKMQAGDDPTPIGRVHGGVSIGPWQLGGFGRWELEHHVDDQPRHTSLASIGGGATFGRKQPVGPTEIVFGTSFGVFSVEGEAGGRRSGTVHSENSVLDPRAGLYAGVVMPAVANLRSRVQLETELALVDHDAAQSFPNVPAWGMALTLGVDFGVTR